MSHPSPSLADRIGQALSALDSPQTNHHRRVLLCVAICAGLLFLLVLDHSASWDDSLVYLVGARALAEGKGYVLLNFPAPHPEIRMYPPLLSSVLSLIWRIAPEYPANLPLLKIIGLVACLAFGWGSALLLLDGRRRPVLVLAAVALFLFHPTTTQMVGATVLSDLPFAAVAVWALFLTTRITTGPNGRLGATLGSAFLVAGGILLRAAGVVPWLLIGGWLFVRKRRGAAFVVVAAGLLAGAFFLRDAMRGRVVPERLWFYGGQTSYLDALRYAPGPDGLLRHRSFTELATLVGRQQVESASYLVTDALALGRVGLPFELLRQGAPHGKPLGFLVSLLGVAIGALILFGLLRDWRDSGPLLSLFCALTFVVAALWPGGVTFLSRYMLPAGIILNYALLRGLSELAPASGLLGRQHRWALATVVLLLPGLAFALRHALNLHAPGGPRGRYYQTQGEQKAAIDWIQRSVPGTEPIAAHCALQVFLKTDHHAIPFTAETIPLLPRNGVRWLLLGPEDYQDHRPVVTARGWRSVWRSTSGAYEIYDRGPEVRR